MAVAIPVRAAAAGNRQCRWFNGDYRSGMKCWSYDPWGGVHSMQQREAVSGRGGGKAWCCLNGGDWRGGSSYQGDVEVTEE